MASDGPLPPQPALPGWAPHAPAHVPGARTRSGNAMGRTRAGLLVGASRALGEQGLRRTTMQSIATAAGVAKATLYNHFRTKDDVVAALLATELERLTALAAALGAHPVLRRLAETEPELLTSLLTIGTEHWAGLVERLAGALQVDADAAEVAARWLLGVVLQPGRSTTRHRHAGRLAAALAG